MFFHTQASLVLITTLYNEPNARRAAEYVTCLRNNIAHPLISKIHVFYDTSRDRETQSKKILLFLKSKASKITITYTKGRSSFKDCFDLANERYSGKKTVVANADIYFDETLRSLEKVSLDGKFFVLTRWNVLSDGQKELEFTGFLPGELSQDVWMFSSPIRNIRGAHEVLLGTHYCETRILEKIIAAGLSVSNPCLTIRANHLHMSPVRSWSPQKGPARIIRVPWCRLQDCV